MTSLSPANAALLDMDLATAALRTYASPETLNRLLDAARAAGPVAAPKVALTLTEEDHEWWRGHYQAIDDAVRILRPTVDAYCRAIGRPRVITSHNGKCLVLASPEGSELTISTTPILLEPIQERVAIVTWAFGVFDSRVPDRGQ